MICQMIDSQYDPFLKERVVSLLDMCKNPSTKPKQNLPQWMFIDLKDPMQIRRNQLNYNNCHALIIEFDNKEGPYVSIDDFQSKYSNFTWILHTTSSHTTAVHKYRCILPLDQPTPYALWHDNNAREVMKTIFIGIDPSSFSNFQKIPAYPANKDEYRYILNIGTKFSYSIISEAVEARHKLEEEARLEASRRRALMPKSENFNYEAYKNKVIENLDREFGGCGLRETGTRYNTLCKYCGKLLSAKYPDGDYVFDDSEVESIIRSECKDVVVTKMVRSFIRGRK